MTSLDVESLFTNIPLEETINISCDFLFGSATKIETILKNFSEWYYKTTSLILTVKWTNEPIECSYGFTVRS